MSRYRCPTTPSPIATTHDGDPILGCGAEFDAEPDHDGLVDCPECGIWFPASEPGVQLVD